MRSKSFLLLVNKVTADSAICGTNLGFMVVYTTLVSRNYTFTLPYQNTVVSLKNNVAIFLLCTEIISHLSRLNWCMTFGQFALQDSEMDQLLCVQ